MIHDMTEGKKPRVYFWYNDQVYLENLSRVVWVKEYPGCFLWSTTDKLFYYIEEGSGNFTPKDESSVPIEFKMLLTMLGVI